MLCYKARGTRRGGEAWGNPAQQFCRDEEGWNFAPKIFETLGAAWIVHAFARNFLLAIFNAVLLPYFIDVGDHHINHAARVN